MPEAMLSCSLDGTVLSVNQPATRVLAAPRAEILGTSLAEWLRPEEAVERALKMWRESGELTPWPKRVFALHDVRTAYTASGALVFDDGGKHTLLIRIIEREQASALFISLNDKLDEVSRENHRLADLELERQIEERSRLLRLQEEETRAIVDSAADAVLTLASDWTVLSCNVAAERLFGRRAADILGAPLDDLLPLSLQDLDPNDIWESSDAQRSPVLTEVQTPREQIPVEVVVSSFETEGDLRYTCIARDITERIATREMLRERTEELTRINKELESFTSVASHDLKQPLRQITLLAHILAEDFEAVLSEEAMAHLGRIRRACDQMQQLIQDLLTLSRVSRRAPEVAPVDLHEVIAACLDVLDLSISTRGATVDVGDLPTVRGDAMQLKQLFTNLISNAIKFAEAEEAPHVEITARREGAPDGFVEVAVRDEGVGFDPSRAAGIFEPFERLHSPRKFSGTGIGLAICQRVVERHGGRIRATSEVGQGATFFIELPLLEAPARDTGVSGIS